MSDRPEDIPEDVWSKVRVIVPSYIDTSSYDLVRINATRAAVARAILQARSQAYAECEEIADGIMDLFDGQAMRASDESDIIEARGAEYGAKAVSQAIRQHSQKGEGNEQ